MRSREMIAKLERIGPEGDEEPKTWDLSLLSPAEQDRVWELMDAIGPLDENTKLTPELSAFIEEFQSLVKDLPLLGRDDREQGPKIEVPHDLVNYWSWRQTARNWRSLSFYNLTKVQTVRFAELCEAYGFEKGLTPLELKAQMIPLDRWQADDRAELHELLAIAGSERCKADCRSSSARGLNWRSR